MKCPKCEGVYIQHKIGKTSDGSQRDRCYLCGCKYTPIQKARGYSPEVRQEAVQLYVDGMILRRIGRHLGVDLQSIANWAKGHAEKLPPAPVPKQVGNAVLNELLTIIGDKKQELTPDQRRPGHALLPWLEKSSGSYSR